MFANFICFARKLLLICHDILYSEVDMEGVIEADEVYDQEMGDDSVEVTEEMIELSQDKRSEAQSALADGI